MWKGEPGQHSVARTQSKEAKNRQNDGSTGSAALIKKRENTVGATNGTADPCTEPLRVTQLSAVCFEDKSVN